MRGESRRHDLESGLEGLVFASALRVKSDGTILHDLKTYN